METMGPELLVYVAIMLVVVFVVAIAWQLREELVGWTVNLIRRLRPPRRTPLPQYRRPDTPAADSEALIAAGLVRIAAVMSRNTAQTDQTDQQTDPVFPLTDAAKRVQLDRTRTAVVELLVLADWNVGQIRGLLKGDSGAIGAEVAAARERLGLAPPAPATLRVRENGGPPRDILKEV
jgi:hypothetical protein